MKSPWGKILLPDNHSDKTLMNICDLGGYLLLKLSNCGLSSSEYHHKVVIFPCSVICNPLLEFARMCLAVL